MSLNVITWWTVGLSQFAFGLCFTVFVVWTKVGALTEIIAFGTLDAISTHPQPTPKYYFLPKSTFLSLLRRWSLGLPSGLFFLFAILFFICLRALVFQLVGFWKYVALPGDSSTYGIRIHCSIQRWRFEVHS
jgi:hypothetical protein